MVINIGQGALRRGAARAVAILLSVALSSCGGGDDGDHDANVLSGDPASRALQVLAEVGPTPARPQDIEGAVLLTRISVVLTSDATVAQLNDAGRSVGASAISFSSPGMPFITLAVPRQADSAALAALAERLAQQPGILSASPGRRADALEVPSAQGVAAQLQELDHLLATRFPAAWNLRHVALRANGDCVSRVTVIMPDYYFGKPSAFDAQMEGSVIADPTTVEPLAGEVADRHGYNVAATLAARFDADLSTGANPLPKCLRIRLVDASRITHSDLLGATIRAVQSEPGRVIVSSSVGYKKSEICGASGKDKCTFNEIASAAQQLRANTRQQFEHGIQWAAFAMRPDVVDRMLIVQAAGNDNDSPIGLMYRGMRSARLGSAFAVATTLADLDAELADTTLWHPPPAADPGLPFLSLDANAVTQLRTLRNQLVGNPISARNLLLVGSATNQPLAADLRRNLTSNEGAPLFAVGTAVSTVQPSVEDGTSYSAPQVAGLVSYLWLLEPTLVNRPLQDTIRALQDNAQRSATLTGIVDAYASALSLDRAVAPAPATARIRLALLDVDANGRFDLEDLRRYHAAYVDAGLVLDPATADYSRLDVNGDGFTGGGRATRMDLDPTGSLQFGAPLLSEVVVAVGGVERVFDENAVTDAQALCYYANTALFESPDQATRDARDTLLRDLCPIRLQAELPGPISTAATITATVEAQDRGTSPAPLPGVLVTFRPTCATVSPTSGRSDARGRISATVTPSAGCSSVTVTVTASAEVGTPSLAETTVTAAAVPGLVVTSSGLVTFAYAELPTRPPVHVEDVRVQFAATQSASASLDEQVTTGGTTFRAFTTSTITRAVSIIDGITTIAGTVRNEPALTAEPPMPYVFGQTSARSSDELCFRLPVPMLAVYSVQSNARNHPSNAFNTNLSIQSGAITANAVGGQSGSVVLPASDSACISFLSSWDCSLQFTGVPICQILSPGEASGPPLIGGYSVTLAPAP